MFWACAAFAAVVAWTRSGKTGSINTPNAMIPNHCRLQKNFVRRPKGRMDGFVAFILAKRVEIKRKVKGRISN
jgi:hypothetical protein